MENQIDLGLIMIYIFIFICAVFFIRWVFRIDRILANLDNQYKLLNLIAEKLGVDEGEILKITNPTEYWKSYDKKRNS